MKFALLGFDQHALRLARVVADDRHHELVAAYDVGRESETIREISPFVGLDDDWESLLLGTVADAVIVAPPSLDGISNDNDAPLDQADVREDQIRKLVQAQVPLLVVQPACSAMVGYELEMIREGSGCTLVPFWPGVGHSYIQQVSELAVAGGGAIGDVEQLNFERTLVDRSQHHVTCQLTRDMAIVRRMFGEIARVSAMGAYSSLNVHVTTESGTVVHWSVGPADDRAGGKMTLVGTKGKTIVKMPQDDAAWSMQIANDDPRNDADLQSTEYEHTIDSFIAGVENPVHSTRWLDSCRELDFVYSMQKSLRRGRTIELQTQPASEEQNFKGVMASWGCLLLMATVAVFFGLALFDGFTLPFRDDAMDVRDAANPPPRNPLWIRLWPFYIFAVFILLQCLQLVFRSGDKQPSVSESSDSAN